MLKGGDTEPVTSGPPLRNVIVLLLPCRGVIALGGAKWRG